MMHQPKPLLAAAVASVLLFTNVARAVPYASGITNTAGTVSFILNESADNVKIVFNGGASTNDLGAQSKGGHSFSLGAATSYEIYVTKTAPTAWTQISEDTNNFVRFFHPNGVAVNQHPGNLSLFGRTYVATTDGTTAAGRHTGRGIYVLNADQSDALGQGDSELTGGNFFTTLSANSPFRIEVGEDDNLYIADFANANANIYRADADISSASGVMLLDGIGNTANPSVHTSINGSPIAKGSLGGGNLTVWAIDGQWGNGNNRLLRWNIGSGPVPFTETPTELGFAGSTTNEVQSDLDLGPDGKFYTCQARTASDLGAVRVFDSTGVNVLWNSRSNAVSGTDPFGTAVVRSLKVSPDGKTLAIMRNDTQTWLIGLTNGIPDMARSNLLALLGSVSGTSINSREVGWDAAGNIYVADNTHERLRVWSPGGFSTAITRSAGTFQVLTPPTIVSVTTPTPSLYEGGGSNGVFVLTRTGVTTNALTVSYAMTGTATNAMDYSSLSGSVTFLPNATSTNIILAVTDDSVAELTETATLSLLSGTNYGIVLPTSATITILDNDTPEVSITVTQSNLLESFSGARATYQISRKGLLANSLTVNMAYGSGTASNGFDFTGPASVVIPANASSTNFNITPLNDNVYEGTETAVAGITTGAGYTIGTPGSATVLVIDDDLPATGVLFSEKFDSAASAGSWVVNRDDSGADTFADFGYNYSADGIPEAPSSTGTFTATRGLKFHVNESFGFANGMSASPAGKTFTGDYRLRFDMWLNFVGPLPAGGTGSTQHGSGGVGTSGAQAVWPSGNADAVWFTWDGDGDVDDANLNQTDYGVFLGISLQPGSSGFYTAGTTAGARGNLNSYYNLWGNVAAPASQLGGHPSQTGTTTVGTMGMAWHAFTITKFGTNVTWDIDGRRVATVDITGQLLSTNVFVGYHDWFPSVTSDPSVEFSVVDNVRVENLLPMDTPRILSITISGGNVQLDFTGGPTETETSFGLQAAGVLNSTFADVNSTITQLGTGLFRGTRPAGGTQQFYRIRRL